MKSTIDGVTYDTETATKIAFLRMPVDENTMRADETTLYRSAEGKMFYDMYDSRRGDHLLAPATDDEAERFCRLAGVDVLHDVFGIAEKGRV